MITLLFARHGETDWNAERRWQGIVDQPLNATGRAQARELAESLAGRHIDAIYASDLRRAHETAEIVGARLGLPVVADPALREVDVGDWSGRVHTELEELEPDAVALWRAGEKAWNGGESYDEMSERVVGAVLRIAGQHPGATLLFVTHGGSIRACRAAAAGVTYAASRLAVAGALANCAVVELRVADGRLAQLIG